MPAATTVAPTTATAMISRLRTRTGFPAGAVAAPAVPVAGTALRGSAGPWDPPRVPLLPRGRFFCTGARILDSSAHEAEMTSGHTRITPPPLARLPTIPAFLGGGAYRPLRHLNE